MTASVLRFLAMLERELGSPRVELVLGNHDARDGTVWIETKEGFRVEATVPPGRGELDAMRARLSELVETFGHTLEEVPRPSTPPGPSQAGAQLDDVLDLLVSRAHAESAWVIDDASPEIWGASTRAPGVTLDGARDLQRVEACLPLDEAITTADLETLLVDRGTERDEARAIERARDRLIELLGLDKLRMEGLEVRSLRAFAAARRGAPLEASEVRRFLGIYELVLVFRDRKSELHVESALRKAMPIIEKLVASLPPRDPVGAGAKVAVLRRLRRV